MRNRLTWRNGKTAGRNKTADPYLMNQNPQDPSPVDYESGDPSSWAEDLHPTNWKDDYDGDNAVNLPLMDDKTHDHTDAEGWGEGDYDNVTASEENMTDAQKAVAARRAERIAAQQQAKVAADVASRADLAIRIATNMLGEKAGEAALAEQSWDLMAMPTAALATMLERMEKAAGDDEEMAEAGDDSEEPEKEATAKKAEGDEEMAEAGDDEEMDKEAASRILSAMGDDEEMAEAGDDEEMEKEASAALRKLLKGAAALGYKLAQEEGEDEDMEKEASAFVAGLKALAASDNPKSKRAKLILVAMDEDEMEEEMEKEAATIFVRSNKSKFAKAADDDEEVAEAQDEEEESEDSELDFELGGMNEEGDVTAADQEILAQLFPESAEPDTEVKTASSVPGDKKGVSKLASASTNKPGSAGDSDLSSLWQGAPDVSEVFGMK